MKHEKEDGWSKQLLQDHDSVLNAAAPLLWVWRRLWTRLDASDIWWRQIGDDGLSSWIRAVDGESMNSGRWSTVQWMSEYADGSGGGRIAAARTRVCWRASASIEPIPDLHHLLDSVMLVVFFWLRRRRKFVWQDVRTASCAYPVPYTIHVP